MDYRSFQRSRKNELQIMLLSSKEVKEIIKIRR
jgi:hypothetical protein